MGIVKRTGQPPAGVWSFKERCMSEVGRLRQAGVVMFLSGFVLAGFGIGWDYEYTFKSRSGPRKDAIKISDVSFAKNILVQNETINGKSLGFVRYPVDLSRLKADQQIVSLRDRFSWEYRPSVG